ncbi:hypothetical protein PGTUg99_011259 [Puccinia graminis f. sp. tritici]|uniref:Uncharacterized protein n=1 Tax=Puccinia graminis f. sp. tritici TaxID=56615 RepID=A0A5B0P030_PUCGR|nr:hypothetical protein PGTUg99_011259 [Puccinia graminis f. sp. tritici]
MGSSEALHQLPTQFPGRAESGAQPEFGATERQKGTGDPYLLAHHASGCQRRVPTDRPKSDQQLPKDNPPNK